MSEERDLYGELRYIGLSHDNVSEVLKWVETLPIHIIDVENIPMSGCGNIVYTFENGKIYIKKTN